MTFQYVGRPLKRLEDPKLITGADPYVADVALVNSLTMAVARSPHAHAEIKRIDTGAALAIPGVVAAFTGADLNSEVGVIHTSAPAEMFDTLNLKGRTLLAEGRVRYVGEPVAAVLAEAPAAAVDGAEAVVVEYEPLPVVVDPERALESGSPLIYHDLGSNLALRIKRETGDVDAAFGLAAVVLELRLVNQRLIPLAIEPRACSAAWDSRAGTLAVWGDTQVPHRMRDTLAELLKLSPEQVHVRTTRVGGGFGAKIPLYSEDVLVPLLARRLGRPVRWTGSRREDIQATSHGRDMRCLMRVAADAGGRILALDAKIIANAGFCQFGEGPFLPMLCGQMITGCYEIQTARVEVVAAFTNTMGTAPYRGAGRPEAAFFIERTMDRLAGELRMDPVELRRRNFIPPDRFPYTTVMDNSYDSGDYANTLNFALAKAGYDTLRREQDQARKAGRLMGIGIACYVEICGFDDEEVSDVTVAPDGSVTVLTGSASHGQGHETAFAQLVAEELKVPVELVTVVHGDTTRVRSGVGTFGSRSLARGGLHARGNARKLREKALQTAANLLEAAPGDLVHEPGVFRVRGVPDRSVSWREVAARGALESRETFTGNGTIFPFGTHLAVVEIDRATGRVRLVRYVSVDDSGLIVNPLLAQGQVHGGLAQGIGQALWEGAVFDETGQLLTSTLMEYAIPKCDDLIMFENDHTRTLSPRTALGVKGIGESATIGSTPAVANAVMDALTPLGVNHLDLPLTAANVWAAMTATPAACSPR
ncbi:MAG: xanthine dehydrogenase family protein molybdopterin-binding subunit [Candidatus Methylomirabilia bacterium]